MQIQINFQTAISPAAYDDYLCELRDWAISASESTEVSIDVASADPVILISFHHAAIHHIMDWLVILNNKFQVDLQ